MTTRGHGETDSTLAGLYDRYLAVVPREHAVISWMAAHSPPVSGYCVEHAFEDPSQQIGERERDRDRRPVRSCRADP